MRLALPLLLLASCAAPPTGEPEDTAALARLLQDPDVDRREEALFRIAIRGQTVNQYLERPCPADIADADTNTLGSRIQAATEEQTPERIVWRAYHVLRSGCLARDDRRLAPALRAQGFRLIEVYEPKEGVKFTRYLARAGAYVDRSAGRHDLFFWTQATERWTGDWVVREVYVGLHATFDAPFKSVAAIERYPRNSTLARFFDIADLRKVALVFPVLEEIEFTYGRIRDKNSDSAPAGFHVNAGFVMEKKEGGRSVYYTAESGLDPRERRGGRLDWDGFVRSEETGPLVPRGSGIWGAGGLRPVQEY